MKKALIFYILIISALVFMPAWYDPASGETREIPFRVGEKMTFDVRWSFILAGEASFELLPATEINGRTAHHLVFTARTTEFVDVFYKVRDRIESYTDMEMNHSLRYMKIHEAKSGKDVTVDFDWDKQQAQYSRIGGTKKRAPLSIPEGTFDPLSVFFAFRLYDLNQNNEVKIPVTDGKKVALGRVNVIKREAIKVKGIEYDTFLVEPELGDIGGVFEKSKDATLQIWVTADNRLVPVRIRSKVAVGSFVAELTSYREGTVPENDRR